MEELYGRMIHLMQHSLKEMQSENSAKETYLKGKDKANKKKLEACIDDIGHEYILSGELEVKILRTPNGKKVGPGTYDGEKVKLGAKVPSSHNIMGLQLGKRGKRSSSRNAAEKDSSLHRSFCVSQQSRNSLNTSCVEFKSKDKFEIKSTNISINAKKVNADKSSLFQAIKDNGQNRELRRKMQQCIADEEERARMKENKCLSYELHLSRKQEESKKTLEKYRKIVAESQSLINKTTDQIVLTQTQVEDPLLDTTNHT